MAKDSVSEIWGVRLPRFKIVANNKVWQHVPACMQQRHRTDNQATGRKYYAPDHSISGIKNGTNGNDLSEVTDTKNVPVIFFFTLGKYW